MSNIVRYPFPAELDEHDAQFAETEEGELVAGLSYLASRAQPAGKPIQQPQPRRYGRAMIGAIGMAIAAVAFVIWMSGALGAETTDNFITTPLLGSGLAFPTDISIALGNGATIQFGPDGKIEVHGDAKPDDAAKAIIEAMRD